MKLPDKVYDKLKWITLVVIPAAASFYAGLDEIFHWGFSAEVTKISALACLFLGSVLGFSTAQYNKGVTK